MAPIVPQIKLSENGPSVSRIIYGTWHMTGVEQSNEHLLSNAENILSRIKACVDVGITTFDLSDLYGFYQFERLFGEALKLEPELKKQIQIITKTDIVKPCEAIPKCRIKHYNTSREYILQQVNRSLGMLGVDHIDLLLLHRQDMLMDADEVAEAFKQLHSEGKVLHFGGSNFTIQHFKLLQSRLPFKLVSNQFEFSPYEMSALTDDRLDYFQRKRLALMAYSPLGSGKLFASDPTEQTRRLRSTMEQIAADIGADVSIDQVCYAWIMMHPANICPVIGTTSLNRIITAAKSVELVLDRQQWTEIWSASTGTQVP
ncbi:hypothetical protein VKS41_004466 [Umbelopsis sp. WA50703]